MKINYITFMVRDIEKTISFYKDFCGLKVLRRLSPGMGSIVFMGGEEPGTMLEFIQFEHAEKVCVKGLTMSFQAPSGLEKLRERLIAVGYQPSVIFDQPPKPAHFTVPDPDGVPVEFSL